MLLIENELLYSILCVFLSYTLFVWILLPTTVGVVGYCCSLWLSMAHTHTHTHTHTHNTHTQNTHTHTHTHKKVVFPGRAIGPSQKVLLVKNHNHKRRTCRLPPEFEPAIGKREQPLTLKLDSAAYLYSGWWQEFCGFMSGDVQMWYIRQKWLRVFKYRTNLLVIAFA